MYACIYVVDSTNGQLFTMANSLQQLPPVYVPLLFQPLDNGRLNIQ